MSIKTDQIRTIELFAGVGGFRIGLERASSKFDTVWSNQWEPATKSQDASKLYVRRFGEAGHCNKDLSTVPVKDIPDHDLLVGGFPCQDYSVARTLNKAEGLRGKKGVLWWEIHRILSEKQHKPKYLFLENVDRLLKSPVKQRGRDFAVMLASLSDLGYIVEWRVINAADYGMPQRRRRVFFLGYHKTAPIYKEIKALKDPTEWIRKSGVMAEAFRVTVEDGDEVNNFRLDGDLVELSNDFNKKGAKISPFENSGIMVDRKIFTLHTTPSYTGKSITLGDVILQNGDVPKQYFVESGSIEKWMYLKGGKSEKRVNKASGVEYQYSEGSMVFPDPLDRPSRTIVTGEGGASPSRFKHVIQVSKGKYRRLMPLELERLNMFPDNHTEGASDVKRAFFMGNALVVGVIERIGKTLIKRI
jgi:DNA (cytosine-5)-methyltransferase 1